ncbi:UNVERIFIED_CONTAM: hypothetical protein FKN15_002437 [Acipenser sinensis]
MLSLLLKICFRLVFCKCCHSRNGRETILMDTLVSAATARASCMENYYSTRSLYFLMLVAEKLYAPLTHRIEVWLLLFRSGLWQFAACMKELLVIGTQFWSQLSEYALPSSKAKASGKKLQKVTLKVSPRGIILYDSASSQLMENISIYRISYCTADKMHDKVFAYIAQSQQNETLECHAFLCTKRKVAQAVTLTVAQSFRVAFEFWQAAKEEKEKRVKSGSDGEVTSSSQSESSASLASLKGGEKEKRVKSGSDGEVTSSSQSESSASLASLKGGEVATGNLLDLEEGAIAAFATVGASHIDKPFIVHNSSSVNNNIVWEIDDGLDEAFSRLAESRNNPQVLDIGVTTQDFQTDECLSPTDWDKTDVNAAYRDDIFSF